MLVAALRTCNRRSCTRLALYGRALSREMRREMERLASRLFAFDAVVWTDDLLLAPVVGGEFSRLRERIGCSAPDELWLCKISDSPEAFAMQAFPRAAVVLYEDGLHTYAPQGLDPHSPALERISESHLLLGDCLPLPPWLRRLTRVQIGDGHVRDVLTECARSLASPREFMQSGAAVVLGQCFARWGLMSRAAECGMYERAIATLLESGYAVAWKEHPRADQPFFPEFAARFGGDVRELALPPAVPVEAAFASGRRGQPLCVSATSTALFTLPRLFGARVRTFAQELVPHVAGDFAHMADLAMAMAPRLEGRSAPLSAEACS
jgi:hypothetical protein